MASEMIALDRKEFIQLMERSPVIRQDVEAEMRRMHELKYAVAGGGTP